MVNNKSFLFLFLLTIIPLIVIITLINKEKFIDRKLTDDDLVINKDKALYNVGDLLQLPKLFYNASWEHNPDAFLKAVNDYKGSVLDYYHTQTQDPLKLPEINVIRQSVDMFINQNSNNKGFMNLLEFVNNPKVLCVHVRSGDYGQIPVQFKHAIQTLQQEYNWVVIMCGIHHSGNKEVLLNDINSLFDNKYKNILICLEDPDIHLSMFRCCRNLLVSKQGFTILGTLLFQGDKLYINRSFFNYNFDILNGEWKKYMELDNRIFNDLIYIEYI